MKGNSVSISGDISSRISALRKSVPRVPKSDGSDPADMREEKKYSVRDVFGDRKEMNSEEQLKYHESSD